MRTTAIPALKNRTHNIPMEYLWPSYLAWRWKVPLSELKLIRCLLEERRGPIMTVNRINKALRQRGEPGTRSLFLPMKCDEGLLMLFSPCHFLAIV